jgi:deoxyadenosine/deoxycytidine kinase
MFIVIEGCIGAGKTTLARLLAEKLKAKVLLEATKKHPFIKDFYLKPQDYAFQTEMNFILIHSHQVQKAKQSQWFDSILVSDFLFDKDLIFSSLTLKDYQEAKLFKNILVFLRKRIPRTDLVLYLKAPSEFLYKRIKKRGRDFERNIPFEYLNNLNKEYDRYFNSFPKKRLLVLDALALDWTKSKHASKQKIVNDIAKKIKDRCRKRAKN